ncbi:hypothetical protein BPAE_0075g00350 [Botrytis paeoniae]|uniref:Cyclase n=1 Tax=Botrytis paeoniae TaxID=278948 RepID=A0A4Z1FQI2_9HELO|nr:hypothetical protein BPAE_0075g00350 [Botrytis paeoniae]
MHAQDLPSFKDIPTVPGMPQGTAWGLFDKNGERDNCGTLNLLTPENTLEASKEIKPGKSVALNPTLQPKLTRIVKVTGPTKPHPSTITASPTPKSALPSRESPCKNGIEAWTTRGGIVGRAVLINYVAYAQRHNISYSPVTRHEISVEIIKEIAREQGVVFKEADVLIARSGFVKWYEEANAEERIRGAKNAHEFVGVKSGEETGEWIWNQQFSAVACDTIGFECWPPEANSEWILHDWLLAFFSKRIPEFTLYFHSSAHISTNLTSLPSGCPIGKLWNPEGLAMVCAEQNRYSFFVTSAPLNFPGGVASPPNAVAIF